MCPYLSLGKLVFVVKTAPVASGKSALLYGCDAYRCPTTAPDNSRFKVVQRLRCSMYPDRAGPTEPL